MLDKEVIQLENSRFILIEVLDARRIRVSTNCNSINYEEANGELVSVDIEKHLNLTKGNTLKVSINKTTHIYTIHTLTKISSNSILISTNYPTKTKHFILPTLGFNKENFQAETFLEDARLNKELDTIYLTYRFVKGEVYNAMETFLFKLPNFKKHIDIDTEHVIYEFNIPKEYLSDVKLFMKGKYSSLSTQLKERILTFYGLKKGGITYGILYKEETRRKQLELEIGDEIPKNADLYDIPDKDNEIL